MKRLIIIGFLSTSMAFGLSACNWKNRDTGAVVGTGVGAVAGNLVTGGSGVGTAVGGAIGGVGGYFVGKSTEN